MRRRHATPAAACVHYHRDMRGGSKVALVVLTLAALTPVTATRERTDPHVVVDTGPIVGVTNGSVNIFRGIPYARPPVGPLRWRAPQPADHWTDPLQASSFSAACPQKPAVDLVDGGNARLDEDCLTLNVWAPSHVDSPAPVMVWLHGGRGAAVWGGGVVVLSLYRLVWWFGGVGGAALAGYGVPRALALWS